MIQLSQKNWLQAKQWLDNKLPKSFVLSLWLKLKLNQSGGIGVSPTPDIYVDEWPNPNIMIGIDYLPYYSYYIANYPFFYIFTDLPNQKLDLLEKFLLDLANLLKLPDIGGATASIDCDLAPIFNKVFKCHLGFNAPGIEESCQGFWFDEEARQKIMHLHILAPEGFKFDTLRLGDAEFVNHVWADKGPYSLEKIQRQITNLPNVCLREKDPPHQLVSFVLTHESCGQLTHLYTIDEFRRRGLATAAELKLAQRLVNMGYLPVKEILQGNIEGEKMTDASKWWTRISDISWLLYPSDKFPPRKMDHSGEVDLMQNN